MLEYLTELAHPPTHSPTPSPLIHPLRSAFRAANHPFLSATVNYASASVNSSGRQMSFQLTGKTA